MKEPGYGNHYIPKIIHFHLFQTLSRTLNNIQHLAEENARLTSELAALRYRYETDAVVWEMNHYREILELLPVAYIEADTAMRILYMNPVAISLSGYSDEDIAGGLYLSQIILHNQSLETNFIEALTGSRKTLTPYRLTRKDGSELTCMVLSVPRNILGKVEGIAILVVDISKEIEVADELRRSEDRFRQFAQLLPQTVFEIDLEGNFLFLNDYSYQMFGYKKTDNIGTAFSMMTEEDRPQILKDMKMSLSENPSPGHEYMAIRKDGARMPVLEYSVPVFQNGRPVGFRGFIIDITGRKEAERQLFESEEKYRTLTDQLPLGIYRTSASGQILFANPALAKILGFNSIEELMKVSSVEFYVNPGLRNSLLAEGKGKKHGKTAEYSVRRKNGTIIWVRDTFRIHVDDLGEIEYLDGILEDFTEKKLLQEKLKQSQKLEALGTLAGGIAHDFNNLLMTTQLYTELALKNIDPSSFEAVNLNKVIATQAKAKKLIEEILLFSRPGKKDKQKILILQATKEIIEQIIASKPANIDIKLSIEDSGTVEISNLELERILTNLCNNAFRAMPQGGTLTLMLRPACPTEAIVKMRSAGYNRQWVELSVGDTGIGMDNKVMERIFDPFFTTREVKEGTGLGLAIVHKIVEQCQGEIVVHSLPGKGTAFSVFLPAVIEKTDNEEDTDRG